MRLLKLEAPSSLATQFRETFYRDIYYDAVSTVKYIINKVRTDGDAALLHFTSKYDGVDISDLGITVNREDIDKAYEYVSSDFIEAVEKCMERLELFEKRLRDTLEFEYKDPAGVIIKHMVKPLSSVGCYVPAGKASYPSTVIMNCVPARVAGVRNIAICSPPMEDGSISPSILVASDIVGVDKIYRVGGAQAIAALAYGTETVEKVDKIIGPGNIFVSIAKTLVSTVVSIDFFAGPTELLILADEYADPEEIALDLVSQAEHDSSSIVGLVTLSRETAEDVLTILRRYIENPLYRKPVVLKSLARGFIAYGDLNACIEFVNAFAPEHLQIMMKNPKDIVPHIENAGTILLGRYTPTSLSDYCLGTNHVLPTMGMARWASGLSVVDFLRLIRVAEADLNYIKTYGVYAMRLAEEEKLINHGRAIEVRFRDE